MERMTYFDRYRICVGEDNAPREISRDGLSVTYRTVDLRSGETVALQLIPAASLSDEAREKFIEQTRAAEKIEHRNVARIFAAGVQQDEIAVVSELVSGETADAWVVGRGPLPADAVLRIGMQVVDALSAAAFHGLSHRALQPSNILILPGQSPDGDWPFIKLLHFGLAGVKGGNADFPEFVPSLAPQFASPEQLQNGTVDFRSEIFSLGATLCFLLTGAVPLAGTAIAERRLPVLDKSQKAMWPLLVNMLRNDPERRPQDPVVLGEEMRVALAKMERRQRRRVNPFAVPFATNAPREEVTPRSPRRAWAYAALALLLLGALALATPFLHRSRKTTDITQIGEPIGVPENTPAPVVVATPTPEATVVAANNVSPAPVAAPPEQTEPASPPPTATIASAVTQALPVATPSPVAIASASTSEASPPAEDPTEVAVASTPPVEMENTPSLATASDRASDDDSKNSASTPGPVVAADENSSKSDAPSASAKKSSRKIVSAKSTTIITTTRRTTSRPSRNIAMPRPPRVRGRIAARYVGTTSTGDWVMRTPSGETLILPPPPPYQPFNSSPRTYRHRLVQPTEQPVFVPDE